MFTLIIWKTEPDENGKPKQTAHFAGDFADQDHCELYALLEWPYMDRWEAREVVKEAE